MSGGSRRGKREEPEGEEGRRRQARNKGERSDERRVLGEA